MNGILTIMKIGGENGVKMILLWISLAAVFTVACGLVELAVQQDLRQGANDPQIQLAEDAARELAGGTAPGAAIPAGPVVDVASSLAPYIVVYNDAGQPVGGSGMLNGTLPALPPGIFSYAKTYGEDRVTWEPQQYVRQAAVIVRYSGTQQSGFVMAARSLREIEIRESQLEFEVGTAWIFGIFIALITSAVYAYRKELTSRHS